jgi:hypothetical protein
MVDVILRVIMPAIISAIRFNVAVLSDRGGEPAIDRGDTKRQGEYAMNTEAKSAIFGLNWLQEGKPAQTEPMPGSSDAKQEVWTTSDGQVRANYSSGYTSHYTSSYSAHVAPKGGTLCDFNCDAGCDASCDVY